MDTELSGGSDLRMGSVTADHGDTTGAREDRTDERGRSAEPGARPGAMIEARLRDELDKGARQVSEQGNALAEALRSAGDRLDQDGMGGASRVVNAAADRLERVAAYTEHLEPGTLLDDAERMARRRPWLVAGAATLVGFTASRLLTASSESRFNGRSASPPDGGRHAEETSWPTPPLETAAVR